jgi:outer membrane protease
LYTDRDWSHWSVSDVNIRWGFILDAVYDWRVLNSGAFGLNIGVDYHLDWWAWRDTTRDSIYSDLNQPDSYYPGTFPIGDGYRTVPDYITVGVNGINYETAYHIPLVSISLNFDWDIFFLYADGRIGPAIAFSKDHHKLRTDYGPEGVYFYDSAAGGPWIDVEMVIGFRINDRFSFSLSGEYAWLNEIKGDTVIQSTDGSPLTFSNDSGGFSFSRIGITALASWNLGGP